MSEPFNFPVLVTSAGMQPQDPQSIRDQIEAAAQAQSPGLTDNLPGILIEDIVSTDVPAVSLCDQARVELVNSLTPNGANESLLLGLGQIYLGEGPGAPSRTSVNLVFSGTVGYVIPQGFLVSDGTNVFQVQTGGVINGSGSSSPLSALALQPGAFGVPAGTVTTPKTSFPASITLSVTNPGAGTPGNPNGESWSSYRTRVMQAGLAACVAGPRLIKTLVGAVSGVQKVSVQTGTGGFRIIVKGGDVHEVAYAILQAVGDPTRLLGHVAGGTDVTVSLIDPPNTYNIKFVAAGTQSEGTTFTWNTTATNFTGGGAFAGLVQPPIVAYVNSLPIGAPVNLLEVYEIFKNAVANLLDPDFLTRLVVSVSINGTPTAPGTGTQIVTGDAESDFFTPTDGSGITVTQG